MADDRAVDHQEERLGDEGAESGHGEGDDLAVVSPSGGLGPRVRSPVEPVAGVTVPTAVGAGTGCRGDLCHALNLIFHR